MGTTKSDPPRNSDTHLVVEVLGALYIMHECTLKGS